MVQAAEKTFNCTGEIISTIENIHLIEDIISFLEDLDFDNLCGSEAYVDPVKIKQRINLQIRFLLKSEDDVVTLLGYKQEIKEVLLLQTELGLEYEDYRKLIDELTLNKFKNMPVKTRNRLYEEFDGFPGHRSVQYFFRQDAKERIMTCIEQYNIPFNLIPKNLSQLALDIRQPSKAIQEKISK